MAKEIELRRAGPADPIYREGTSIVVGGQWGRKKGAPAYGKPSQPRSDGNERGGLDGSAAEGEMQNENERGLRPC